MFIDIALRELSLDPEASTNEKVHMLIECPLLPKPFEAKAKRAKKIKVMNKIQEREKCQEKKMQLSDH